MNKHHNAGALGYVGSRMAASGMYGFKELPKNQLRDKHAARKQE